jgi:hypothetical protein
MNYIWDLIVKAKNEDIDLKEIEFRLANSYSPYMELSNQEINFSEIESEIEINPYYRFLEIFKSLFLPNYNKYEELRNNILDIMIHFLTEIDIYQGMDKVEYHKKFIYEEIKNGYFGDIVKKGIENLDFKEKNILLRNIYKFYNTGNHIYHLKETIKQIFENSIVYVNNDNINEILIYISQFQTQENLIKLKLIKKLFLPLNFKVKAYWGKHFGIIGVIETMKIGEISVYRKGGKQK